MAIQRQIEAAARRLRSGEGFTIIEVLIASFILVLGALAIFMTFAAAIHNVQRSRETQIGVSVAQREIERVRVIPFDSIRLSSTPAKAPPPADSYNPYSRIEVIGGVAEFDVERDSTVLPQFEQLMVPETTEPPQPPAEVEVETPDLRSEDGTEVTVYRFVTCQQWEGEGTDRACVAKRVIIDVLPTPKANLANYRRNYYELQTTVINSGVGIEP